jgi:hypothetical protein
MTGASINVPSCFPVPSRRFTLAGLLSATGQTAPDREDIL